MFAIVNSVFNYEKEPQSKINNIIEKPVEWKPTVPRNSSEQDTGTYKIEINNLSEYSGLSKKEIYEIRKHYVSKSIFANPNYEPNYDVFGAVEDGKPWYGIDSSVCFFNGQKIENKTKGPSSVSKFVNNPAMLIGIMIPYSFNKPFDICKDDSIKFIPVSMKYEPKEKRITAVYSMSKETPSYRYDDEQFAYYTLITINARDFGYKYGYISELSNIIMNDDLNMAKEVRPFMSFIHVGYSCGLQGGCNNVSPRTTDSEFQIQALPAQMDFKLWKKQPFGIGAKADINYRMIFKEKI